MKLIKTEADYNAALKRLDEIFLSEKDTPESDEAEVLVLLIENYDRRHYSIGLPDPVEAIRIRMDDLSLKPVDMKASLGNAADVSMVLGRKKKLTLVQIQRVSKQLAISLEVLAQEYDLIKKYDTDTE